MLSFEYAKLYDADARAARAEARAAEAEAQAAEAAAGAPSAATDVSLERQDARLLQIQSTVSGVLSRWNSIWGRGEQGTACGGPWGAAAVTPTDSTPPPAISLAAARAQAARVRGEADEQRLLLAELTAHVQLCANAGCGNVEMGRLRLMLEGAEDKLVDVESRAELAEQRVKTADLASPPPPLGRPSMASLSSASSASSVSSALASLALVRIPGNLWSSASRPKPRLDEMRLEATRVIALEVAVQRRVVDEFEVQLEEAAAAGEGEEQLQLVLLSAQEKLADAVQRAAQAADRAQRAATEEVASIEAVDGIAAPPLWAASSTSQQLHARPAMANRSSSHLHLSGPRAPIASPNGSKGTDGEPVAPQAQEARGHFAPRPATIGPNGPGRRPSLRRPARLEATKARVEVEARRAVIAELASHVTGC